LKKGKGPTIFSENSRSENSGKIGGRRHQRDHERTESGREAKRGKMGEIERN